ncbi:Zn-ribbon domain-containing OB-fold protein [Desulfonema magnum]|uniref:Hydroxybenzylsuccinyl-CoA thiolase, subunit A n=1 Tax=Desulfonema magnum TaxID=45655 RepID=A0A975BWM8_9BACT|nr:OB-fold domain-containing protein [Desulfonema magnum]QTA92882.1 Hydroxybenzylsuccinyl-CoA thiolase, subunit A [Desulfonema magnum]
MAEGKKKKKEKEPDITFFHPDLLEVPEDGSPPYLKGYKCKKCGKLDFPKLSPCPTCWGEEFEMIPLSRKGILYSFADIYIGQPGMDTPYIVGYIDLPEEIRIFAQLDGEVESFKCDEEVELTTGPIRMNQDGLPIISYKFKKVSA